MSKEDKYNEEAKEKIKALVESIDFTMFITRLDVAPLNAAPMSTKKVDAHGEIWFLSSRTHDTVMNIEHGTNVQLCYSDPGKMEFLSIFGEGRIVEDKSILKLLYQDTDDAWFDGVDDPNLRAIAVMPKQAQYWEPKNGKVISLLKMAYGAATGKKVELGNEGKLKP